jgi:malonyl CoA-acyl carrier protein transacylase
MKTYIFPGQGSQSKGMGGDLFDQFPELTRKADAILGYSIKALCLEDPRQELGMTQFTQPALYTVNALSYFQKIAADGQKPDFLAGHSLGEFNALMAAGCFDFETGLKLVKKRGELMSKATGGAMAAVINASRDQIESALRDNGLDGIDIANYNAPAQIVISGAAEEISKARPLLEQGRVRFFPLNTSGAFHSRHMRDSRDKFSKYLKKFVLSAPEIPVIANVSARPYSGDAIHECLAEQIAGMVRWSESVQYLMAVAVRHGATMAFTELGHGDVLKGLVAKIKQQTTAAEIDELVVEQGGLVEPPQAEPAAIAADATGLSDAPKAALIAEVAAVAAPDAKAKVAAWNASHPVGTRVKSTIADYDDLETRTEALVLFGHRAAVYMKGYNGYFDLDELVAA